MARLHIFKFGVDALIFKHLLCAFGREVYAAAAYKIPLFGKADVVLYEMFFKDNVAVRLYDVFALATRKRLVANCAKSKSVIFVPNVDYRHFGFHDNLFNKIRSFLR